jgi:putative oxidoreductase
MELALLVLRIVVGGLFAAHGAQKLFGVFEGAGIDGTAQFFDKVGLRPGRFHAQVAGYSEFFGGICLALGILTPFAALVLIAVMTAAIMSVHYDNGIWNTNQGYEFNLVLMAAAFVLAASAGTWSLDNAFNLNDQGAGWALFALIAGIAGGAIAVAVGQREMRRTSSDQPRTAGQRSQASGRTASSH